MQQLLHIRKTTGIGQPALADFLGMTRQGLARMEKGMFRLSTDNLVKLVRLQACIDNLPDIDDKKQMTSIENPEHIITREKECRYFVTVLERRLLGYETAFKKMTHFKEALNVFTPADEAETLWIQKTKIEIIKKLDTCGVATCMRIRKRIYLLIAEADYLNRFVNENQSNLENH